MYSIFASQLTPFVNNRIFCNAASYSSSSIVWNAPSGFNSLFESRNKPYLSISQSTSDNSANVLALNPSYLFYWDRPNLKAFNKATGASVGTPITNNLIDPLYAGGIYADACNNVYVGNFNGVGGSNIKVYNFNGTIFNDAPADIVIPGYTTKSTYDMLYDEGENLLYACGDGFVTAIDISATCATSNSGLTLNVATSCNTATATLTPAVATGTVVTYSLYTGTTLVSSNTTGVFTGLLTATNYKVRASISDACNVTRVVKAFVLSATGPAAPTVTTPIAYCQGATAVAVNATGVNLLWYTTATGGTGSTTAPIPNTATVGSTSYYVSQNPTGSTCGESPRATIVVNVAAAIQVPPTVTTPITYCQGATATALTATGTFLRWYTQATGGTATTAPTPSTAVIGSTTYYVSQSNSSLVGSCESPRASITVNVTAVPTTPTVTTPITYCQGAMAAVALTATGTNLLWYTTATGGTGSSTAPIPSTAVVGSTTYYVSQSTAATNGCQSPRVAIVVNITAAPAAPIVTANTISYCQGATVTALSATGTNLLWYATASGGTGSSTAPIPSTAVVGTTNYYVSQTNPTTNCESPRASIAVQVNAIPAAPTVTSTINYCQGATAVALTATGVNLLWYTTATGGTGSTTAPIPSTAAIGNTIYYVSQTSTTGNCESPRAAITVNIASILPAPQVTSPISYCQGAAAVAVNATGVNLLWYSTATGGTGSSTAPIPSTTNVGSTTYYVSQSNTASGCGESSRAAIVVNITPLLTVNAGNTITINAGTSTQLNATATAGADYTWTSSINPITLSNIKILNPVANPLQTTTYLLTVKDLIGTCPPVNSSVQVIVISAQQCINIRNAFTPNGDGKNDLWLVYDQDYCLAKDGVTVQVYNRYGSKVYEKQGYKNTWDGTYQNKPLPDGTYYAVIATTLTDGTKQTWRKDVSIVR